MRDDPVPVADRGGLHRLLPPVRRRSSSSPWPSPAPSPARSPTSSPACRRLRADLPTILAPWQERLDGLGFVEVDLAAQATTFLDNLNRLRDPAGRAAPADRGRQPRRARQPAARRRSCRCTWSPTATGSWRSCFRLVPPQLQGGGPGSSRQRRPLVRWLPPGPGDHGPRLRRGRAASRAWSSGSTTSPVTAAAAGLLMAIPFFGPFVAWAPPVLVALFVKPDAAARDAHRHGHRLARGHERASSRGSWPRPLRIHPIVVLGSVLVGLQDRRHQRGDLRHPDRGGPVGVLPPLARRQARAGPVAARAAARARRSARAATIRQSARARTPTDRRRRSVDVPRRARRRAAEQRLARPSRLPPCSTPASGCGASGRRGSRGRRSGRGRR